MWLLLSRRFRRFILLSVAIPLAPRAIRAVRRQVERHTGPTSVTRWLIRGEVMAEGLGKRPAASRRRRN